MRDQKLRLPREQRHPRRFCPRDGHPLKVQMTHGVPVDRCHECDGVWLDPGEILEIAPHFPTEEISAPSRRPLRPLAVRRCPGCRRGSLIPHYYGQGRRRFEVDVCDRCDGLWLDFRVMRGLGQRSDLNRSPVKPAPATDRGVATGRLALPSRPREWFVVLTGMPLDVGNPCSIVPFVTIALLVANVAAYLLTWHFAGAFGTSADEIINQLGLTKNALRQGDYFRLLSALFLHANVLHLTGNLFFLYTFGDNLEERYGGFSYLVLFLACGMGAGFASTFIEAPVSAHVPHIGASGAISGLLGAYLVTFPRTRILMGLPFLRFVPIVGRFPVWFFLGFWLLFNVITWFQQQSAEFYAVDSMAHIAGFALGVIGGSLLVLSRHASLVNAEP